MWCDAFITSGQYLPERVSLFRQEDLFRKEPFNGRDKVNIVLIDGYGYSKSKVKKIIEKHWDHPVFILCAENKQKNFAREQYVMGFFSETVSSRQLVKMIMLALGNLKTDSFDGARLSIAEDIILKGVIKGYSNKQIARLYDINLSTVKYHLQRLYQKLGVNNRVQAALIANKIIV